MTTLSVEPNSMHQAVWKSTVAIFEPTVRITRQGETGKESSHHKEMPRQRWEMDPPPPRTAGQASARMNAE